MRDITLLEGAEVDELACSRLIAKRGKFLTNEGLRSREHGAIQMVKATRCIPREFNMLSLIFSNRNVSSPNSSQLRSLNTSWYQTCEQGCLPPEELDTKRDRVSALILP